VPIREFDSSQGMSWGVGFNSVAGEVRGDCVLRTDPEPPLGVTGQEVVFKLRQITTSSELAEELNISASGSFRAQFGKASAKASYASQQNINRFSVYLLVQVLVTNPVERMRDVKLTAEAWDLLEIKGEEEFRERCGDEFLSGITTGGEYLAILQITTKSEEERKNVSASVRAKGGTWRAGADFKFALEKISEEQEIEVTSFQQGGDTTTVPNTLEEILERAVNFPQQVKDKSFPYTAFFQDYAVLDLPPGMNPIDVANQKRVIEKLADYYLSYSDTLNSIEYVFKNPAQFEDFDAVALNTKANEVRGVLNTLVESASSCFNNYKSCKLPDDLSMPVVELPTRKSIADENAPRWVVPKVFGFERPAVFIGPGEMPRDFGLNILAEQEFETYVFDPLGGKVIPLCTGSLKDGVCSQDNYTFQLAVSSIPGSSPATRYLFHVPNPEKAPSKTVKITLKSEKSGLTSDVELLLVERDQVPDDVTRIFRVNSLGGISIIDI